jgi:hypothetical protein
MRSRRSVRNQNILFREFFAPKPESPKSVGEQIAALELQMAAGRMIGGSSKRREQFRRMDEMKLRRLKAKLT